jgi:anaerobic C4-dicarboxylate transporter
MGLFPGARPKFQTDTGVEQLSMVWTISLITLSATALMLVISKAKPERVASSSVMRAGLVAVISILGIAWLGSTFFDVHQAEIVGAVSEHLQRCAWLFAFALFFLSILLYSQAATVAALMAVGLQLGISPILLIAMFPATNGIFFLPTNAAVVAAIQFDSTGTTSIGRWVLNHSFMRAGLVCTTVSVVTGFIIARIFY